MLSADILLKGLGGLAVVGGATTVGVCYKQEKWIFAKKKVETLTLEELAGRVGLVCSPNKTAPTATVGVECSKKTDANVKVKVKKDNETFDVSTLPATGGGKIKVYKTSEGEKHNNGFKFVVEEGDVSGEGSNKKLEEFETYEIKEADDKTWYLTKKTDVNVGIKKALGLPDDSKCDLPTNTTDEKTCDLDDAKFKKINFEGGDNSKSVTGAPKLKISKVEDSNSDYGTYKFKFVLESAQDATISKTVTIKKGTNTEFKIKKDTSTKTLTLEKAWTLETLGAKVGLKNCGNVSGGTGKECGFDTSTKVNLFNGANDYTKQATVKSDDASKKIKVEEEQEGYSQGFKFYAEENKEITLQNGTTNQGNGDKKIEKKGANNSPTYEIKYQTLSDGTKDWYLSKVTKTQGS